MRLKRRANGFTRPLVPADARSARHAHRGDPGGLKVSHTGSQGYPAESSHRAYRRAARLRRSEYDEGVPERGFQLQSCCILNTESSPRELLVLQPMRNDGVDAQPPLLVFFIVVEVAFKPFDVAVAFEGKHVGGDAVEKPAVVA